MRRKKRFLVSIGMYTARTEARTPGAAFRLAVRTLIRRGRIKRQPPTDYNTGGWKHTSIGVLS